MSSGRPPPIAVFILDTLTMCAWNFFVSTPASFNVCIIEDATVDLEIGINFPAFFWTETNVELKSHSSLSSTGAFLEADYHCF